MNIKIKYKETRYYMNTKNKIITLIIILSYLSLSNLLFAGNSDYISLNKIISFLNLNVDNDYILGKIILKKDNKSIILFNDSAYILIDNKQFFINDFIMIENGQIFIPVKLENIINNYFNRNINKSIENNY